MDPTESLALSVSQHSLRVVNNPATPEAGSPSAEQHINRLPLLLPLSALLWASALRWVCPCLNTLSS